MGPTIHRNIISMSPRELPHSPPHQSYVIVIIVSCSTIGRGRELGKWDESDQLGPAKTWVINLVVIRMVARLVGSNYPSLFLRVS